MIRQSNTPCQLLNAPVRLWSSSWLLIPRFRLLEWHSSCSICCIIRFQHEEDANLSFLRTNLVSRAGSFEWYQVSCGFDPVDGSPEFPPPLKACFSAEDDGPLWGYLAESPDLKWLQKIFKGSSAILKHTKLSINERFFYNPYSTNWLADNNLFVYAHLPGDLSLNQIDHCTPNDSPLLSHDVFSTKVDAIDPDSP